MDIETLHHYQNLKMDIDNLEKIKQSLYYDLHSPAMSNETHSSTPGAPTEQAVAQIARYDAMIIEKKEELKKLADDIVTWSWSITDLEIRAIVNWHYLQGLTWKQTSKKMQGYESYNSCRKKFYRYFDKKTGEIHESGLQ